MHRTSHRQAAVTAVYIYGFGVESCATRLIFAGSAPLRPRPWPRMAPLVEFGAVLGISASLTLPAPPLPSSSRRYAPQCFVGGIPPPRLATCLTAHPTNRVAACRSVRHSPPRPLPHLPQGAFFLRSICARRRPVSSLNLVRVSPGAKRSRRRRAQCGVQICRAALVGAHLRGDRFPAANLSRFRPHRNLISSRLDFNFAI